MLHSLETPSLLTPKIFSIYPCCYASYSAMRLFKHVHNVHGVYVFDVTYFLPIQHHQGVLFGRHLGVG